MTVNTQEVSTPGEVAPGPSRTRPADGEYTVIRKRKRHRSTKKVRPISTRQERTRYLLLGLIVVLLIIAVAGASTIRRSVTSLFHTLFPRFSLHDMGGLRVEVIALLIAGLVVLYLIPGVEERVLTFIGVHKPKKKR